MTEENIALRHAVRLGRKGASEDHVMQGLRALVLVAIDDALQRIADKTYGICESCEGEIQLGRLKILPFTRLCVKCQEENEKEAKRQKTLENERGYRKLDLADTEEDGF